MILFCLLTLVCFDTTSLLPPSSPDDPGGHDDGDHDEHECDHLRKVDRGDHKLSGGLVAERCTVDASGIKPPLTFNR